MKPRTKLCWLCGRKFRGNHFTEKEIDGHLRELHKECGEKPDFWMKVKGIAPPAEDDRFENNRETRKFRRIPQDFESN